MTRSSAGGTIAPPQLRECPGCGLFQTIPPLAPGMTARARAAPRPSIAQRGHPLEHSIALTLAALVLLVVMCTTTLMSVQTAGIAHSADLFSGPEELVQRGMPSLAAVVVFVTVLAPFGKLLGTLYVLLRLHEARAAAASSPCVRAGRAAAAMVDDRGLRVRRVRRLCEAGRSGAHHARTPASTRCSR